MDWIRQLASKHTLEVMPRLYDKTLKKYGTVYGYTYASAFDALNIAHANGVNIASGLENGTLRLITNNNRYALINLKKEDEKMMDINVTLTETQIEELVEQVEIENYVTFLPMDDFNDYMEGVSPTDIIDAINFGNFDTSDAYAVKNDWDGWTSADNLEDIVEPFLDDMLQDYLDANL